MYICSIQLFMYFYKVDEEDFMSHDQNYDEFKMDMEDNFDFFTNERDN